MRLFLNKPLRAFAVPQALKKQSQAALLVLWAALSPAWVFAQAGNEALRDPAEVLRQQQEMQRRMDSLEFESTPLPQSSGTPAPGAAQMPEADAGPQFQIHQIDIAGDKRLARIAQDAVKPEWLQAPLGVAQINFILQELSKALIDAGYITSRVYVGEQNLASGVLKLNVAPGIVEDIVYNGESLKTGQVPLGVRASLALRLGAVLRLQDIEQSVDQLNRLHRNQAQVQVIPGQEPSGSVIEIVNQQQDLSRYSLSVDNQGSSSTGRVRLQGSVDLADGLGLMERISLGLSTSKETNALFGSVSLPWGYNTFSLNASISEYQDLIGDIALVYGRSNSVGASWNRVLARNQTSKTTMDLALTRRNSKRHINNVMLSPQTLTVVRLGVDHMQRERTDNGVMQWVASGGWTHGMRWFNALRDLPDDPREAAKAQFDKLDATLSLSLPLSPKWAYYNRISAQWTSDALYSSEQIFAGGMQSVRGVAESFLLGDRGVVFRNEWVWNGVAPMNFGATAVQAQPYTFLDGASVQTIAGKKWDKVVAAGVGARIATRNGSAEVLLGRPLTKPSALDASWRFDVRLAYMF